MISFNAQSSQQYNCAVMDHSPFRQTFELGIFISWKEDPKFSEVVKFRYKIL